MDAQADAPRAPRFADPDLPPEDRIDALLEAMTLEEKILCLGTNPSVPRLGVRGSQHVEGLHGLALGGPGKWGKDDPVTTTTFPQAIGLAQTWDPEVVRRVAEIESYEARYAFQSPRHGRGGLVVRAPNADLGRDPRWGRTEECYGEDAFLGGVLSTAFVRGLQGDDPKYWRTAALLKHFLANSTEDGREDTSADFDERLMREYYAWPFERAVRDGGARCFMAAYNAVNSIPCTVHPVLRTTVEEWGVDGIICTDAGALRLLVSGHQRYTEPAPAAADSVHAGITQFLDQYREAVDEALARGLMTEADIDAALRGNFRVMLRLGLLDPPEAVPYAGIGQPGSDGQDEPEPWSSPDQAQAVREATRKSIVLLKNSGGLLPLQEGAVKTIAVIGPLSDTVLIDWYSGTPPYAITPLAGIRKRAGENLRVLHAGNNDTSEALRIARLADVCVVCVGNHPTGDDGWAKVTRASYGKEAVDRRSLELEDEKLVKEVFAVNPNTVLVLLASFPYAIEWSQEHLPAILQLTHNSQELGNALADVLFGDYNPAGRLVQTWPRSLDQLPPLLDFDLRRGRTYMYFQGDPLYPFGHGLSYTDFEYTKLETNTADVEEGMPLRARVSLKNTGTRDGEEVVQLYVRHLRSRLPRPLKELKGFRRVAVPAGETRIVDLELRTTDLGYWDADARRFLVEDGEVEISIGASSSDIRLTRTLHVRS